MKSRPRDADDPAEIAARIAWVRAMKLAGKRPGPEPRRWRVPVVSDPFAGRRGDSYLYRDEYDDSEIE